MWRSQMTAMPVTGRTQIRPAQRRVRWLTTALLAGLAGSLGSPVLAQVTPPDPATRAAMDKRTAARTSLSSALARIAANGKDTSALLDAGRASIDLEDYRAGLGFLLRAEQAAPRDPAIKAALGSVMVRMESASRALDYFGEAQLLGASERLFLSDRGLARDLLGQQDAAQRDYQLALSIAPNDETLRRYALSLGISGQADRGVQLLTPQLRAQDRGAWRMRAMILAMNGRNAEATEIVNATMPPALAQGILPYLTQMNRLNPAQQAAAAHFGRFPAGKLGPPRDPVQVAAAAPAPTHPPAASSNTRRRPVSDRTRVAGTLTPATATATPPPVTVRRAPDPVPIAPPPEPETLAAAPPATTIARSASTSSAPAQSDPAPAVTTPAASAALMPAPVAAAPVSGRDTVAATATLPPASQPVPAAAASIGVAVDQTSGPVGPGFSIADIGKPAESAVDSAAVSAPNASVAASATPPAVTAPASAAPLASLADIIGSIEIPPEEMARQNGAVDAATLAKLQGDKRRAEAAEAAQREKDAAAAKAKADADAKAKAAADEKRANPARAWVQIATGADARALAFDYRRFAKKYPDSFKGQSGATAEWNRTRRLLVGPFKDGKAASAWLSTYEKAGGDGFTFNSDAGQTVDPLK